MRNASLYDIFRIGVMSLTLGAVAVASAQTSRTFTTGPAAVDSTYSVFPQINETYSTRPMKPANPRVELKVGPANTLTVDGGVYWGVERVLPGARFPGITATGWDPPDPTLATGPNHVVVTVNTSIAFFSKTGTKQFQQDLGPNGFFASVNPTNFVFDPKVFFDQVSRRFVVVAPELDQAGGQSKCLVAVSDDADPNGTWYKYRIEAKTSNGGNEFWLDYPGWGYNKDAFVITGNMFPLGGGGFGGVQFIVLQKAPMLSGGSAQVTSIVDPNAFTAQVCHTMDSSTDKVFCIAVGNNTSLDLFAITNITSSPTLRKTSVPVPRFNGNSIALSRNNARLDTVGSRLISSYYRGGRIVATHTVGATDNDNRAAVRWYEVDVRSWPASGSPSLVQSGQVVPPVGQHYWMPGICSNRNGDITIVFNRCSATISADMMTVARKRSDPAGTMGAPKLLWTSAGAYGGGSHRWGDYAEACTDPNDDSTFWGIVQIIAANNNWSTEVQKWTVTAGGNPLDLVVPIAVSTFQGNYVRGTVADVQRNDESYYQVGSVPVIRLGSVAAMQMDFRLQRPRSEVVAIDVTIEALTDTDVAATGMIWLYNWTTGQWDHKKSFPLKSTGQGSVTYSLSSGINTYVNASGDFRVVVRGLTPTASGAKPFTLKVDLGNLALSSLG